MAWQVVEKDHVIAEKEKLYLELKAILARQPGPEVAEQLSVYQSNLKDKTRQMKALAAELNMYHAQVRAPCRSRAPRQAGLCAPSPHRH